MRVDLDRLYLKYSGVLPSPPPCAVCDADLELAFKENDGYEEWHCSNVPSHTHFCRTSDLDRNVLAAVAELRDRRKDEIGYQNMIRNTIDLINRNDIDEAVELLEAWEESDDLETLPR
jgi:hypothetical protein